MPSSSCADMPPDGGASRVTLGLDVVADAGMLARFPGADRLPPGAVPATFPIVWLADPAIRAAIEGFARPGEVAFHEDQAFDYEAALKAGASYAFVAEIERLEAPARIAISGRVERQGETLLTMRTLLRLVDGAPLADSDRPAGAAQQ